MARKSKTKVRAKDEHETETPSFRVKLCVDREGELVTAQVTIYPKNKSFSMYHSESLTLMPKEIPEVIEELQWAHRRWLEGKQE